MADTPGRQPTPEVGTLSADGSRMWDGRFWVRREPEPPLTQPLLPAPSLITVERPPDRRGLRPGGVLAAAVVGVLLGHLHFTLPASGSLDSALSELVVANLLWQLFTYGAVVVILSLGRQGVDVLLLRSAMVAFVLGAAFVGLTPLVVVSSLLWLIGVVVAGLISALLLGPVLAVIATLANFLWYRSVQSLRPQLRVFNRGS